MPAHGLMFHHFHDGKKHIPSQGSITGHEFNRMLILYKEKYHILDAVAWFEKSATGTLSEKDACVTFDDGLRCQFDIALPILNRHNLKAFWFINTAHFDGAVPHLELYRYFRFKYFKDITAF